MHLGKYAKRCPPLLPIQFFRGKQHIRDVILTICLCHVTEYVTNHNHWCFFGVALKHLGKYVKIGIYYLLVSYYSCLSAHLSHLEGCQLWWSHILTTDGTSPWQTNKKTAFFIRQTRVDSGKNNLQPVQPSTPGRTAEAQSYRNPCDALQVLTSAPGYWSNPGSFLTPK